MDPIELRSTVKTQCSNALNHYGLFAPSAGGGTDIEYRVNFKFKSHIVLALVGASFAERTKTMVKAFVRRTQRLYGVS